MAVAVSAAFTSSAPATRSCIMIYIYYIVYCRTTSSTHMMSNTRWALAQGPPGPKDFQHFKLAKKCSSRIFIQRDPLKSYHDVYSTSSCTHI